MKVKIRIFLFTCMMSTLIVSCAQTGVKATNTPKSTENLTPENISGTVASSVEPETVSPSASQIKPASTADNIQPSRPISRLAAGAPPNEPYISIRYVGNSCFYIVFPDGTRMVTDPYGVKNEYYFVPFPELHADIITISHRHDDHMGGMYEVKDYSLTVYPDKFKEKFTAGSVEITGYPSEHVHNLGSNTVFIYKSGDFKIVNMAETDLISDKDALEEVKGADVLLMYAGEYGDVKNEEILNFAKEMCIPVIIPEHYSMQPDNMFYGHVPLNTVLSEVPEDLPIVETDQLYVTKEMDRQFVVLDPWRDNLK